MSNASFAHRLRRTLRTPLGVTALVAVTVLALVTVLGPALMGAAADRVDTSAIGGDGGGHLFGVDHLGRDVAARVVAATGLTIGLTLLATAIGTAGGLLLGVAPAMLGTRLRRFVTATVGVLVAFPGLLFVLFLATIFGLGTTGAVLAVGLATVPPAARLVQNLTAGVIGSDYVAAARILGVGRVRLVARHVLPNIAEPVVLFTSQTMAQILVSFSGLSFLGIGVQPPEYDWGRLLNEQLDQIYVQPVVALAPGAAIILAGLTFSLVGEVLARASGSDSSSPPLARDEVPPPSPATAPREVLLQADDLRVTFPGGLTPVRGVSLSISEGEAVGLVGESGSGKSLTALALAGLVPHPGRVSAATLRFDDVDLLTRPRTGTSMAMVFQDPMASLNPALRVGRQLAEVTEVHLGHSRSQAAARAVDRLGAVRIPEPERRAGQRPHEYSGGMRQRAMIGMGLMGEPKLIIADEPTTALDVLVQQQVLDLLAKVRAESGAALILVSHDIAVVAQVCRRVMVMYGGRVVEELPVEKLRTGAAHPYTRALIGAVPTMSTDRESRLATIPGRPPEPAERPEGCAFAPRCERANARCLRETPALEEHGTAGRVACWHPYSEVGA
ncbi:peptide ABC transporter ATP-binding protein [Spongiactinospora rosea]|uniref:Peptide ABC transporter ATP-binding protein n=1 Tax=Spongiactinospora rosea TaxID=2248750 RepID=A0A366LPF7_9ACTN|nr:dipeptide/oligopeptide/nickel ABC transporter permease/ATP-binding protein [Spongiactinospora rosea]RBQ15062.1 peptide ABC transporter ATP-binding protein [Spongiactinospora rosea]